MVLQNDADGPVIRQAVRNIYTNCTNPNFNSSGTDTVAGINNLTVDHHGKERDWVTLPNRKEHFGDLQRMVDNDLYDILLQKIKVPSLQTVMHGKQQSSWAPGLACVRHLNTAYGIQEMTQFMPEIMAFVDLAQGASTPIEHCLAIEDCMANLAMRYDDESKGVDHARWLREVLTTLVYMSFHSAVRQNIKEDMKAVKDTELTWNKIIDTVKRDQRYSAAVGDSGTAAQARAHRVEALSKEIAKHESARAVMLREAEQACTSNESAHVARAARPNDLVCRNCRSEGHNRVDCRGRCAVSWCNADLSAAQPRHAPHCPLEIKSQADYRADQRRDRERAGQRQDDRRQDARRDDRRDRRDDRDDRRDRDQPSRDRRRDGA